MPSLASVVVALCLVLAAVAYSRLQRRKPVAAARACADASPNKITDEEHARRRLARLAVLEEMSKRAAEEARVKAEAAAARAAEERQRAAELARGEAQKPPSAAPAPAAAERAPPAAPRSAPEPPAAPRDVAAAPRAALQPPPAKLQASGGAPVGGPVGVRVQFVQGRAPLQLTLPFPLPTVGELKQRVQEAYAEIPPERQRLVFAGQILAPDDKDLALVKNFGDGACVICQEIAAPAAQ